jgi:sugar lactone lactonase YvrE
MNLRLPEKQIILFDSISIGGGVSLVIPVNGTRTQQLVATRGQDVVLLKWNHENSTFENLTSSDNVTVIASVETSRRLSGNRWNDGKADAKGRL